MGKAVKLPKKLQNPDDPKPLSSHLVIQKPKKKYLSKIAKDAKDDQKDQETNLVNILTSQSLITYNQLIELRKHQQKTNVALTTSLIELGYLNEEQISKILSEHAHQDSQTTKFIDLSTFTIPEDILKIIPKSICLKYFVIPLSKIGNTVVIAISNLEDSSDIMESLSRVVKEKIKFVQSSKQQIEDAILTHFKQEGKETNYESLLSELERQFFTQKDTKDSLKENVQVLTKVSKEKNTPIIRLVNMIILKAIKNQVSDIHIEPYEQKLRIRFRIDGTLYQELELPKFLNTQFVNRVKVMCQMDISEKRKPQDGRFKLGTEKGYLDFRVSILPTVFGEKCVLRLLDKSNLQVDMESLGFESKTLEIFKENIKKPYGMILVTGPTGSGKTTTLYSALSKLNKTYVNLNTVEDPVEFNISGINQVQVNPAYNIDFASILRSFLRQDPDIIMVGEIRDIETLEIAIKASLTGHLVLSTLHTNDAPSTLNRMVDMGAKPFMITASTNMVISQRLIRKNCSHCSNFIKVNEKMLLDIGLQEKELSDIKILKGKGCNKCNNIGYKGRIAIFELMVMNNEIQQACIKKSSSEELKKVALKSGMQSLRRSALNKLKQGLTTIEEVTSVTKKD